MKVAIFIAQGANCTGCKLAIEKFLQKVDGVEDVVKDSENKIQVSFTSNEEKILESVPYIVEKLGYIAELETVQEVK